jgi:hypothetical protein
MDDAFRCIPLQVVASLPSVPSGLRMEQSGPSDFTRCESRHTGRIGACSWLCERTHPRSRSLNAAARSQPHCRHRQRPSRLSIRTLSGVSRWPLPHWSGTSLEAILRRRSALENGTIVVLLAGIRPPLPLPGFQALVGGTPSGRPRATPRHLRRIDEQVRRPRCLCDRPQEPAAVLKLEFRRRCKSACHLERSGRIGELP